ncbi:chloride channel protein [Pelotalea chapellei]|uniref:Chloride channel protein n=1 Tax=Pelotalea chapellei TaxID=44671 RepID=A0ABS5U3V0_9BACT|nr:chloride channel protein [Pelotalea chapellei]MBT1070327.1 chloride channel protein [Pelotalea chapellei]
MKPHLSEHVTLFSSIVKWTIFASVVGMLAGLGTAFFLKVLSLATGLYGQNLHFQMFLPASLLVSSALTRFLAPDAAGHGTEKVIEAVHQRAGHISFRIVPVKLAATIITLASGGSAGKEGPCAQIAAALASSVASVARLPAADKKKLVICGISAGFATVFGTEIAGALFGIEVLVLGQMMYDVLFPSFVAAIVGYHVATSLGVTYPYEAVSITAHLSGWSFVEMLLLGVWCGIIALFFIQLLHLARKLLERFSWHWSDRALIGGALLVLIGTFVSRDYLGLGLSSIETALHGGRLPLAAFFWKTVTTSITLGCGGSGGVLTPIFFIGSSAGNLFASLFHESNLAAFSAIGMVAVLAAAANTPIAASVMAMEMFGSAIGPHAAVACMTSFLIVGYHSVYPSQLLGIQKSASLSAPEGSELGVTRAKVTPREKSLLALLLMMKSKARPARDHTKPPEN